MDSLVEKLKCANSVRPLETSLTALDPFRFTAIVPPEPNLRGDLSVSAYRRWEGDSFWGATSNWSTSIVSITTYLGAFIAPLSWGGLGNPNWDYSCDIYSSHWVVQRGSIIYFGVGRCGIFSG